MSTLDPLRGRERYNDVASVIAELRRQAAARNATWPCVLLSDLMPLCDEYERLRELDNA